MGARVLRSRQTRNPHGCEASRSGHSVTCWRTGFLRDVVLFGAFLLWAIVLYVVSRRRDRVAGTTHPAGTYATSLCNQTETRQDIEIKI